MCINKQELYSISCDNCDRDYEIEDGAAVVFDSAEDAVASGGWATSDDGDHYCPNCHTLGDDDRIILKQVVMTQPIPLNTSADQIDYELETKFKAYE